MAASHNFRIMFVKCHKVYASLDLERSGGSA